MLTILLRTVRRPVNGLLLAVFFSATTLASDGSLYSLESGLNSLVYELSHSVVTVEASRRVPAGRPGDQADQVVESVISSGIIFDSAGHIMVAAGAVAGKDRILVTFDKRVLPASLVATDYQSGLSLLEVAPCCGRPVLISDRQACAGQMVVALGSAYGMRAAPSLGFCAGVREDGTMQFSAPVASGAVGGGVFDLSGRLLGIITGGIGTDRRMALALPAHRIPEIIEHLLTSGDRYAGFIGISTREIEISPATSIPHRGGLITAGSKLDQILERGVIVTSVRATSPAHQAGLMPGDLVFSVDDIPVNSAAGLERMVLRSPPGRTLEIELLRQDRYYAVSVVVDRKQFGRQPTAERRVSSDDGFHKIDSLKQALQQIKDEIFHLEQRLYRLD